MKFSSRFFCSVLLAVVSATIVSAAPFAGSLKHTTTQRRELSTGVVVESFHLKSSFETFGVHSIAHPLSTCDEFNVKDTTVSFIQSRLNVHPDTVAFRTSFANDVAHHAFVKQQINGVPVANTVANVAFNKANKVVSFGSLFVKVPSSVPPTTPSISVEDTIVKAESLLSGKFNEHPPSLEFVTKKDGSLALTHIVQIQNDDTGAWFEAFIDAHSDELVHLTDFVAKASYRVLPITKEIIPDGFEVLTNPQNLAASHVGWHSDGTTSTTDTLWVDADQAPTVQVNIDATCTNTFYLVNTVHDITYLYRFTEAGFNFQNNNFGKGRKGNDRVTVSVHNSAGIDNANFATPPDGQSGHMRMFLWDHTNPRQDGALENDIVVHENTHGITNHLTGGGTGHCLQTNEAGGMGEGWSDANTEWTEYKSAEIVDFVLGQYVINNPAGIRSHPYSTDPCVAEPGSARPVTCY
ncbi:Fungalysin metallopeptidase-domain-containing protein [Trametes polyzona]|nr:Fungalysin metallopeptidase-domain-containing protein [Trametes polyzona]